LANQKDQEQGIDGATEERQRANYPFCWGAATHVGKMRDENEDRFLVEPELGLFLVSDGMGGHEGGAQASKIVVTTLPAMISERLKKRRSHSTRALRGMLKRIMPELNDRVRQEGANRTGLRNMGATVVMALLIDKRAYIANLGDSRLYRLRGRRLRQLTEEHSVVSELIEEGHIEPHEGENHPDQGQITRYVGIDDQANPYVRTVSLKEGDRLLLCSDGLTDVVNDKAIAAILRAEGDPQASCRQLIQAANAAGGHDNVTVIVVDWGL
jgi:serine/threonine protein phosphatase PrpC